MGYRIEFVVTANNLFNGLICTFLKYIMREKMMTQEPHRSNIGILIIMSNDELMKRAAQKPNMGCDGTFSIVAEDFAEKMGYEFNTIMCKYTRTGKTFSVLRALISWKTAGARRVMIEYLRQEPRKYGLQDPLLCYIQSFVTLINDFETTYALSFP